MIDSNGMSRLFLCPVEKAEDGEVLGDAFEPTPVPFNENGKKELEDATERAAALAAATGLDVQVVEYTYTYEDQNLIYTVNPPKE